MDEHIKKAASLLTPALFFHTPVVCRRAHGIYVDATDGKTYMDFASGLATANVGHSHPKVVEAVKAQAERLVHAGCIFHYDSVVELAERLRDITPDGIDKFFFANSGTESVEGAIKLARYYTKRPAIIAFSGSFHGRTMGSLTLTSSSSAYKKHYHPLLPAVYHAPYPYCYRCPVNQTPGACSTECFSHLERIFNEDITPEEVACIIIEPVLGEGGYVVPPAEYISKLRELCTRYGILFIADEVQTGFGRTGKWFASEHFSLKPDIMTMAKGIAAGMPLGVVGASKEIMDSWPPGAHGTTFGGNPVSCAAALASIRVIEEDGLLEKSTMIGASALTRLREMQTRYPAIGDVRGMGFMIGIEFVKDGNEPDALLLKKIMDICLKEGLIIVECGREKNIARLMPPLITEAGEMERALDIFEEAIRASI